MSELKLLSIVIPARDEAGCIEATLRDIFTVMTENAIAHEIIVVDDGSTDQTWEKLWALTKECPTLRPVKNDGLHGFGCAVNFGLNAMQGDAVIIMMADQSDDSKDAVTYWRILQEGYDCAFGSRFIKGGSTQDYPRIKLLVNRIVNFFIRIVFNISLNDTTNAFKAYRNHVIKGCQPLIAPHFNLTVELPLKAIVRGYTWKVTPISWRNRESGVSKLKLKEMGSRYFFICAYVWFEKYFSRGDYHKKD